MPFRLRHAFDKVLREEQCSFREGRGYVDRLSFIGYEQVFDSISRKALVKVLSLYGIPPLYGSFWWTLSYVTQERQWETTESNREEKLSWT